jgi:hypothetical protein
MQHGVLNRATIRVANTTGICGRAAARSINGGSHAKRQSSLGRICGSTIFGSLGSLDVLAFLVPIPVQAPGPPSGTVLARISALEAEVAKLQSQVTALQAQLAAVQSNNALALGPFVRVPALVAPHLTW